MKLWVENTEKQKRAHVKKRVHIAITHTAVIIHMVGQVVINYDCSAWNDVAILKVLKAMRYKIPEHIKIIPVANNLRGIKNVHEDLFLISDNNFERIYHPSNYKNLSWEIFIAEKLYIFS